MKNSAIAVCAFLMFTACGGAQAAGRLALVIVQRDYPGEASRTDDASDVIASLKSAGFLVQTKQNLKTGKELQIAVEEFARSVPTMGTAVVYISGHATSYERSEDHNVVMPTVAKWNSESDVRNDGLDVEVISTELAESGARQSFIIVEAPQENPLAPEALQKRGFKQPQAKKSVAIILSHQPLTNALKNALPNFQGNANAWLKSLQKNVPETLTASGIESDIPAHDANVTWLSGPLQAGANAGDHWVNKFGMVFVWCPAGSFTMGSENKADPAYRDAVPVDVTLSKGFWIAKYELTQREFRMTRGRDSRGAPTLHKNAPTTNCGAGDSNMLKKIHQVERDSKNLPDGWEYRPPTEAEWEYACRAGTTTRFCFGNDVSQLPEYANFADKSLRDDPNGLYAYAHADLDDGIGVGLSSVGTRKPNAWGIHDMHGNVYEWCRDNYQDTLVGGTDPLAKPKNSRTRVVRGGAWVSLPDNCRSGYRAHFKEGKLPFTGLRLVIAQN